MKKSIIGFFVLFSFLATGSLSAQAMSILPYPSVYNSSPIVSGVSGPQFLSVNQTGTWKISAYDPQGDSLSYSVVWGDVSNYEYCPSGGGPCSLRAQSSSNIQQSAVFTHNYLNAGNYNPTFIITNSIGQSVSTSLSLKVKGNEVRPSRIGISGISGPQVLSVGQIGTWKVSAYGLNHSNLSYSVDWGDVVPLAVLGNQEFSSMKLTQNATFSHVYQRAGNYKIKFTVTDDVGHSVSKTLRVKVKNIEILNYNIKR